MLEIRPAGPGDVDALIALDPLAARYDPARVAEIERAVHHGHCHVALIDGVAVGYVVLTPHFFDRPFIELLMVAEPARRRGRARAMLDYCVGLAGPEKLFTSTNRSNLPMRSLLTKAGFVPSGQVDNLDDGDPELIFVHLPR